jgi:hypothetical protein
MRMPQGFRPDAGSMLFAQVAGKDGQGYLMRMGEHLVRAQSGSPLQVGQSVQLKVQGEKSGQLQMQMMPGGGSPARHNTNELATSLSNLKIPVSEANLETAKAMVEHKIPLTKENFQTMQQLTRVPEGATQAAPMATRVGAAVLLQQNQLPCSPQNVSSIANFLAQNPQLGQQMAAMNDELRRLIDRSGDSRQFESAREMVLELIDGQMGGMALGKNRDKRPPMPPKKFFDAAKQAGIEFGPGPFGSGEDEWELLAAYREARRALGEEEGSEFSKLLSEVEDNLQAQRLLNRCHLGELGCFYFQIPLRWREDAEVWLYYRRRSQGGQDDLGDEFRAEFLVNTEYLGGLLFVVEASGLEISVVIEVEEGRAVEFVTRYAPVLEERINQTGWRCQGVKVTGRQTVAGNPWLPPTQTLNEMESYDVQA